MARLDLKPWPTDAYRPYLDIVRRQSVISAMVDVALEEGIKERNKEVVKRLAPLIYIRAREAQEACRQITDLIPAGRRGRLPKWYTVSEETAIQCAEITKLVGKINDALRRNEMIYVDSLLKCCRHAAGQIKGLLASNPYRAGLEVWEDVIREAFNDPA